jgi:hypothetical protein
LAGHARTAGGAASRNQHRRRPIRRRMACSDGR